MEAPDILAIDTATEVCSVALLRGDESVELTETVGQRHSERVLPMVDAVLSKAGIQLSDVGLFAFGAGPGSFTGLRIACGITQGLAYGKGRRVVAVGNLRALAARAFALEASGTRLLAAIDARMNEVYCAAYRRDDSISELVAPALEDPHALAQLTERENIDIIAGNALRIFPEVWAHNRNQRALPEVSPGASDIARVARIDAARGLSIAPAQAAPIYVRDRVAMTVEERRALHAAKRASAEVTG